MTDDIIERLRAKAWTESGSNPIVELHHAEAAVREAGAECDAEITTARHALLDARLEVTALRAENARLREAGNALAEFIPVATVAVQRDEGDKRVAEWRQRAGEAVDGSDDA